MDGPIDPFDGLIKKNGAATVSCNYKRALQDYGKESIGFHVSLTCDQDEQSINEAGKMAFMKCLEMTSNASGLLEQLLEQEAEKQA